MPFKKGITPPGAKPFIKGQSGNPKGPPVKLFAGILSELTDKGYNPVKRAQIVEAFELLLGLPETELTSIMSDNSKPMLLRICAKRMFAKDGFEVVEKMLDRAHGKANQSIDHSVSVETPIILQLDERFKNDTGIST